MIEMMGNIIKESNFDLSLRVIVITGDAPPEGKKASFSAGADLAEQRTLWDDQVRHFIATVRGPMIAVENAKFPVIAAIN
jgi:enoyl-CoA hydratase/carnithine racemase